MLACPPRFTETLAHEQRASLLLELPPQGSTVRHRGSDLGTNLVEQRRPSLVSQVLVVDAIEEDLAALVAGLAVVNQPIDDRRERPVALEIGLRHPQDDRVGASVAKLAANRGVVAAFVHHDDPGVPRATKRTLWIGPGDRQILEGAAVPAMLADDQHVERGRS